MWQSAYRGLIDQAFLDGLTPEARARRYTFGQPGIRMPVTLVAVRDATISGFVTFGLCRDEDSTGEVMAIYVDPSQLGTGVGRLLIEAARASACAGSGSAARSCGCWKRTPSPGGSMSVTAGRPTVRAAPRSTVTARWWRCATAAHPSSGPRR